MSYAKGERAYGFCDRCGFRYDLKELKGETVNGTPVNNKVCPECWDHDHPQNFLWRLKPDDPRPLKYPRPDPALADTRNLYSWNPVGNQPATSQVRGTVGVVQVTTE